MDKKRLLAILLICMGVVNIASAVEVISIDINHYDPNAPAYSGEAAVPGATQWIAYWGGWGVPVGSPKSSGLIVYNATPKAGIYAEQVWIGDPGNHNYIQGSGTGLMDDGFVKRPVNPEEPNTLADPNVTFFGGKGAYGGTFDMYVYGSDAGSFNVKYGSNNITKTVSGGVAAGQFVEGGNYVVFSSVQVSDPNTLVLTYSNKLNGVQLVSKKVPVAVQSSTVISAINYDVAYDTNNRTGESTLWGPDLGYTAGIGSYVSYLQAGEYMDYDLNLTTSTMGQYNLSAGVVTTGGAASMQIFVDGMQVPGALVYDKNIDGLVHETNIIKINLFPGIHTLRWKSPAIRYNNIVDLRLSYFGTVVMSTCAQVKTYGFKYAGDLTGDCQVDMDDLALLIEDWANCYDPEGCN